MPWYCYIALRHIKPKGRFFSFFTFISLVGIALGVSVLIIVISVFNGFGHEIRSKISETYGDLRIETGQIIADYEPIVSMAEGSGLVDAAAPYAHGMVLAQYRDRPVFPAIQGIDVELELDVSPIANYLQQGSIDDLDDDTIFVSSGVAKVLGLRLGSQIEVYTPLMLNKLKNDEILLPRSLTVVGIFHTGWNTVDENTLICTLRLMQELYGMGDGVHGVRVNLADGVAVDEAALELASKIEPPFRIFTWKDSNQEYLAILQFEKRMMFFLLFIIVIVSAFSIMSSLLIAVVRKTREIGVFISMGATSMQVASSFCLQGFIIGVFGTAGGFALGFLLLQFRNEITKFIAGILGAGDSMTDFYAFSFLPVHIESGDLAIIAVLSICVATLAGLLPAYKASKLKPVDALRSE